MKRPRIEPRFAILGIVIVAVLATQLGAVYGGRYSMKLSALSSLSSRQTEDLTPKRALNDADWKVIREMEAFKLTKEQHRLSDDRQLEVLREEAKYELVLKEKLKEISKTYEELSANKPGIIKVDVKVQDLRDGSTGAFQKLIDKFFEVIESNRVPIENRNPKIECSTEPHDQSSLDVSYPAESIRNLAKAHKKVVDSIPGSCPFPDMFHNNGYVMLGGGFDSWLSLLGVKFLRRSGSTLPVEVFLRSKEDYDESLCEVTFPSLNAKCVMMPDRFGQKNTERLKSLDKSQLSTLLVLASSFQRALWLSNGVFPAVSLDYLFDNWMVLEYGLITWRNKYATSLNPAYFEVARLHPRSYRNTADHSAWFINKQYNFDNLMLAAYYDIEGKESYYNLFSQTKCEAGVKDSISYATLFFNKREFRADHLRDLGGLRVQYDPVEEFESLLEDGSHTIRPLFYEIDGSRLDPEKLVTPGRVFGSQELTYDLDLFLLETMDLYVCESKHSLFQDTEKYCKDYVPQQRSLLTEKELTLVSSEERGLIKRPEETADHIKQQAHDQVFSSLSGVERLPDI
ncbi:hypothetical protein OGAPHI_002323 [Ogataea philodendri]|uniref:Mannosyltransferase n=1 Tax=Ogataea philodendri TaxID=1378263 RepID=A0A9P8T7K9_9ASCO|nr:uncharacterized protein OGAPHI_002323 [Ogataea philodendri]KAH3668569.1 hypothetical protein OGAPHI_002323 [Ogataea philodendri]